MLENPFRPKGYGVGSIRLTGHEGASPNRRAMKFLLHGIISTTISAAWMLGATPASSKDYVLGPQDKLRIKVYEWRASRDTIFDWAALNDVYTIGPDGSVSLPLIGAIKAAGLTTDKVADSIGNGLMKSVGLARAPNTAVEIVQFRPFYVVGKVTQSGEFAYRPGLTVLQALSLAGGLRIRDGKDQRFEREAIQARGDISLLGQSKVNLMVRKARLEAELSHAGEIQLPPELLPHLQDNTIAVIVKQEQMVFQARSDGLDTQIKALQDLRAFLEKELTALEEQLVFLDKQIDSIQKELKSVSTLVDKGLAVAPREFSLERTLAQAQGERLSAETSLLRGRQEISKTDISILELQDGRKNEVTNDLRQTQAELDSLDSKTETARQLLYDSEVSAPALIARQDDVASLAPVFTIFRPAPDGSATQLQASETTSVEPGDTIKVEIPMPSGPIGAQGLPQRQSNQEPAGTLRQDVASDATGIR